MSRSHFRQLAFVWSLAFLCGWGWNDWNLRILGHTPGAEDLVREQRALATADDPSYLRPVEDLLVTSGRTRAMHVFRTPGYGLWYLLMRLLLPLPAALTGLVLLQCALFALSVALMHHTNIRHSLAKPLVWTITLAMATLPMFQGFLFHTLTEGVTPALCIAVWASAMEGARSGNTRWMAVGTTIWALLVLTRPVLAWVGLPLLSTVAAQYGGRERWRQLLLVVTLGLVPTAAWWLRNVVVTGGPIALHPVYSENTNGLFRPTHRGFWELAKSWGIRGDAFHGVMVPAFNAAMQGRIDSSSADAFIASAPQGHLTRVQRERIRGLFIEWEQFTRDQLAPSVLSPPGTIMGLRPEELLIVAGLERETKEYRRTHALHHHLVVPFQVLRTMVLHSNLNLYMFQHTHRGRWWMESLRWMSGGLHLLLFLVLPLLLMHRGVDTRCRATALGALAYLTYLAYVQRGVEERYTLPVLHLAMAMTPFLLSPWKGRSTAARPSLPLKWSISSPKGRSRTSHNGSA
jgi:hypothetical protein